ncbi:MAG: hypothetical protein M1828_005205 [Chrysothrix sp. TS-e1954]|nr:MAG: hypothetical protein M1828_005205 [Chrysothrix sp. TS-e1954]
MLVARSRGGFLLACLLGFLCLASLCLYGPSRKPWKLESLVSPLRLRPSGQSEDDRVAPDSHFTRPSTTVQELAFGNRTSLPKHLAKSSPSFRLLISNATRSPGLCRTILSAAILGYPPPTLVNYFDERLETESNDDEEPRDAGDGSRAEQDRSNESNNDHKEEDVPTDLRDIVERRALQFDEVADEMRGVDQYLHRTPRSFDEHDLLVVVQSGQSWFQLPPNVFVHRYEQATKRADTWSRRLYGEEKSEDTHIGAIAKHTVLLGARRYCALTSSHAACTAVPKSPIETLRHKFPGPKFAGYGIIAGQLHDLTSMVHVAAAEVQRTGEDARQTFTRIFGKQESARKSRARPSSKFDSLKKLWKMKEATAEQNSRYEGVLQKMGFNNDFGLFLDYDSSLIQTRSQAGNVEWISFDREAVRASERNGESGLILPVDLASAGAPWRLAETFGDVHTLDSSSLSMNATLDDLPESMSWANLSLAVNRDTSSVPVALHFDHDMNESLDDQWRQMWFHPWARALMRNRLRVSEGPIAAHMATLGGDSEWDVRGGRGGVWTAEGNWLAFEEVCAGFESEIFGDGKGEWGDEGGDHPHCFKSGKLWAGKGNCPQPSD